LLSVLPFTAKMNEQLVHGNIILRPVEPEDVDVLYQWENNMEIWELSNTRAPFSKYVLNQYIMDSAKDIYETKQLRLIIENQDKKPVGAVDLFDFDPYHQRAGVGILIHDEDDRRKGYALDALHALANYALSTLGLRQIYANIGAGNTKSILLFEKAGFILAGTKKNWLRTSEGWTDELLFQRFLT
jgi:diamine N-acetyltransferase